MIQMCRCCGTPRPFGAGVAEFAEVEGAIGAGDEDAIGSGIKEVFS